MFHRRLPALVVAAALAAPNLGFAGTIVLPDVLTDEVNALLFDPGDIDSLGKQLVRMLTDDGLRSRLSARALEDSVAFRPAKIAGEWATLYQSLASLRDQRP